MIGTPKDNSSEDKKFKKVVQHFLKTSPKPHKPKVEDKKSNEKTSKRDHPKRA